MAQRLSTSMRKIDRLLKNGLFTGNFNIFAQAQPRCIELRPFLSQPRVYASSTPQKGLENSMLGSQGGNKGATEVGGNGATAKSDIDMKLDNGSATPPPTITPNAPVKDPKPTEPSGGVLFTEVKNPGGPRLEENVKFTKITWEDFAKNYLLRWTGTGNIMTIYEKNVIRVYMPAGASGDSAKFLWFKIDNMGPKNRTGEKNKMLMLVSIGIVGILGGCWVYFKKFMGQEDVENDEMETGVKTK